MPCFIDAVFTAHGVMAMCRVLRFRREAQFCVTATGCARENGTLFAKGGVILSRHLMRNT